MEAGVTCVIPWIHALPNLVANEGSGNEGDEDENDTNEGDKGNGNEGDGNKSINSNTANNDKKDHGKDMATTTSKATRRTPSTVMM